MIKLFKNKNIFKSKKKLNFDIKDLYNYVWDLKYTQNWYGVSFQFNINQKELALTKRNNKNIKKLDNEQISLFINKFLTVIDTLGSNEYYIQLCFINKLFPWIKKGRKFNNIYAIKPLVNIIQKFSSEDIKGYISLSLDELKVNFKSLFFYSFVTFNQDIYIISTKIPLVIILNNHLTIDIVTNDLQIFNQAIEMLKHENIEVKIYR